MLAQIEIWNNSFGSAWTGDIPESGQVMDVYIIERQCACGQTTRKLRANPVLHGPGIRENLHLPICALAAYGRTTWFAPATHKDLRVWAWTGRCGGYAILNPCCLFRKHQSDQTSLPAAKRGYTWFDLATQGVGEDYALLAENSAEHALPIVRLKGECPSCRSADSEGSPCQDIVLANDGLYTLRRVVIGNEVRYKAGCYDFTLEEALAHWSELRTDDRAKLFRAALLAEQTGSHSVCSAG